MKERKRWPLYTLIAVESVLLALLLLYSGLQYLVDDHLTVLYRSSAPSGTCGVTIYQRGEAFLFGAHTLEVYLSGDKGQITSFTTTIANDGATLNDWNCTVDWEGDAAVLTLRGEEQADVTYRMSFASPEGAAT